MMTQRKLMLSVLAAFVLLLAACGDDGGETNTDAVDGADDGSAPVEDGAGADSDDAATDGLEGLEDSIDDMVDGLEEVQASQGGGSATLVVGDQQWTFDSVLCAFGEEMIGQDGAVFNLSSIADGLQLYASVDSFGHSVSLDDIEDFENPSVSLSAGGGEFINIDGKSITAEGEFMDGTSDSFDTVAGTLTATCP